GNGATGCTITNSNGNLACSGTVTSGGVLLTQYWQRNVTTLSPYSAGDNITTSGNISTSGTGSLTAAGLLIGNGNTLLNAGAYVASSSGNAALTVNQSDSGDIITASAAGVPKFTVSNSGLLSLAGSAVNTGNYISAPNFSVSTNGAISAATATNTINGLVINSG